MGTAMRSSWWFLVGAATLVLAGCSSNKETFQSCLEYATGGFLKVADDPARRFLGKVEEDTARCRGGDKAVASRGSPWVDWQNYWATGDAGSRAPGPSATGTHLGPDGRGIDGSLLDIEYQRIELIKFNLFDNSGTYRDYVSSRDGVPGPALKTWKEMRL